MRRQMRTYAVCYWNPEEVNPVIKWLPSYLYASLHEVSSEEIRVINRLTRELLKRNKDDRRVEYKIQHPGAEAVDEPIYQNALFAAMDAVCNHAESIAVLQYVPALGFVPYDVVFLELIRS